MEKLRTVDTILTWMKLRISNKEVVTPQQYLTAAEMLLALVGDETDKLYLLEQKVAIQKASLLAGSSMSVANAKVIVEAADDYREARMLKAKVEQIYEIIRIAKLQARMKNDELRS